MVHLRAMTEAEYERFMPGCVDDYVRELVAHLAIPYTEARARAEQQLAGALPAGLQTPGALFWHIVDGSGTVCGSLWVSVRPVGGAAFIYSLAVEKDQRGKGIGTLAMGLLEADMRRRGVTRISLNVFGDNAVAQALYRKSGYEVTSLSMHKDLGAQAGSGG